MLYYQILDKHASNVPAVIYHDEKYSYGELRDKITAWAAFLQEQGLAKGERVGLLSRNCSDFICAYFAVVKAGGVVVPINYQLAMPEVAYIVKDAGIKKMIVAAPLPLEEALQELNLAPVHQYVFADFAKGDAKKYVEPKLVENDCCTIIYTSGTTGKPKGAMLSHKNLVRNALDFTIVVDMRPGEKNLCVLPMYHCFAWTVSIAGALCVGGCIVIQDNYTLGQAVDMIEKYQIEEFFGVPTMMQMFLDGAPVERLKSLRFFISGGAPLPHKLGKDFKAKFGKPVQEGYGLSEASPVVAVNPDYKIKAGSIGLVIPEVIAEIHNEKEEEVAPDVVGELCVKGPNVMLGYLNAPEETAHTLRNGWLHTGDMAFKDKEGYMFIVDRLKDMIIAAGENIYPREIEEVLYKHPAVKEVAVIGIPDKLRGQAVTAYVVLKPGVEATKPELRRFLKGKLANYKLPKYFVFLEQMPKTQTGKILKKALREMGIEDRVHRLSK
jgi:long-chain acyl-CoA synthetase